MVGALMPAALLTEPERRALTRLLEARVRTSVPLAPRWLRRSIAERMVGKLAEAATSSDVTRSSAAQAAIAHALGRPHVVGAAAVTCHKNVLRVSSWPTPPWLPPGMGGRAGWLFDAKYFVRQSGRLRSWRPAWAPAGAVVSARCWRLACTVAELSRHRRECKCCHLRGD